MSIEQHFDVPLIAGMALREKQIQQNYRPLIGVHKWFARRPGTLFRGLILSEFGTDDLDTLFFRANDLSGIRIADPFMGGGTPLIEANRLGCDVQGFDINPMSTWIVREQIEHLELEDYARAAAELIEALRSELEPFHITSCPLYGDDEVPVKSFLWVKVLDCEHCGQEFDLFPGYLVAATGRHPQDVLVCPGCGDLNAVAKGEEPGGCTTCRTALSRTGPARRGRCPCPHCGQINAYPKEGQPPFSHRLFALEYHNPKRRAGHKGRFFKKPDAADLARLDDATRRWTQLTARFVPDQAIPAGDETTRLHRWGYTYYRQMFNPRQLLGLELSCRLIAEVQDKRTRHALATNLSDLLRYQNMLCRYDTKALKAMDIFSVHGFPIGLVQCEANPIGISSGNGSKSNVGSGGWTNIVGKYIKAKQYCDLPFEVRRNGSRNVRIPIYGEWIGERHNGNRRSVELGCKSATEAELEPGSLDAVFTDPPYLGNVQYSELMDFCYVWLRRLAGNQAEGFDRASTSSPDELTGNATQGRDLCHFAEGLATSYARMAHALKPGAPLAFTFHHNKLEAYSAVGVAILDAGLVCSASLPCPAEMGGSIHIHGTSSSILDTVFVCRTKGSAPRRWLFDTSERLAEIATDDRTELETTGRLLTQGDIRCIIFGHLTRMAVWELREDWDHTLPMARKIKAFDNAVHAYGDPEKIAVRVWSEPKAESLGPMYTAVRPKGETHDAVSF